MIKRIIVTAFLFGFVGLLQLFAASSDTQIVTMEVTAINEFAISGSAPSLTVNTAVPGSEPTPVSSTGITWAYTSNDGAAKKVVGKIDTLMPANTTLGLNVAAPATGGSSAGVVILTATDQDLVTGIPLSTKDSGTSMTYTFTALSAAGVLSSFTRTATLTLLNNA